MHALLRYHIPYVLIVAAIWVLVWFGLGEKGPANLSERTMIGGRWGMSGAAGMALIGYFSLVSAIGRSQRYFSIVFYGGILFRALVIAIVVAVVWVTTMPELDYAAALLIGTGAYVLLSTIELFFFVPQSAARKDARLSGV